MFFFGVENEVLNLALFARFDVTSIISTNIAARLLAKEYGICERVRCLPDTSLGKGPLPYMTKSGINKNH